MMHNIYYQSDIWRAKRKQKLVEAGYQCQICLSKRNLQVHHKHYGSFGHESMDALIVLCRECHRCLKDRFKRHDSFGHFVTLNDTEEQDKTIELLWKVSEITNGLSCGPDELFKITRFSEFEAYGRASEMQDEYWVAEIKGKRSGKCRLLTEALEFILGERQ